MQNPNPFLGHRPLLPKGNTPYPIRHDLLRQRGNKSGSEPVREPGLEKGCREKRKTIQRKLRSASVNVDPIPARLARSLQETTNLNSGSSKRQARFFFYGNPLPASQSLQEIIQGQANRTRVTSIRDKEGHLSRHVGSAPRFTFTEALRPYHGRPLFGSFRTIAVCGGQKRPNTPVAAIFFGFAPWVRRFAPKVRTLFYRPLGCAPRERRYALQVRRYAPHPVGYALASGRLRWASFPCVSSHRPGRLAFEGRTT